MTWLVSFLSVTASVLCSMAVACHRLRILQARPARTSCTELMLCFGATYRVPLVDAKNFQRLYNHNPVSFGLLFKENLSTEKHQCQNNLARLRWILMGFKKREVAPKIRFSIACSWHPDRRFDRTQLKISIQVFFLSRLMLRPPGHWTRIHL